MTTAIARPMSTLQDLLERNKHSIVKVLPKHLTADRLIKVALVACARDENLKRCTPESVLKAVMVAAELGLDCGGTLGSAYLVPYGRTCTLITGYRGLIDLARRSGAIRSVEARPVFPSDHFKLRFGLDPVLEHEPSNKPRKADELLGVYCVAAFNDGGHHVEWMTREEVNAIRDRSPAGKSGPWKTDYVEMARKTVVRRAAKYWPLSPEMQRALEAEDEGTMSLDVGSLEEMSGGTSAGEPTAEQKALREELASAGRDEGHAAGAGSAKSPQDGGGEDPSPSDPGGPRESEQTSRSGDDPAGGSPPAAGDDEEALRIEAAHEDRLESLVQMLRDKPAARGVDDELLRDAITAYLAAPSRKIKSLGTLSDEDWKALRGTARTAQWSRYITDALEATA